MTRRLLLLSALVAVLAWGLHRWPQAQGGLQGVAGVTWPAWPLVLAGLSASYLVRSVRLHARTWMLTLAMAYAMVAALLVASLHRGPFLRRHAAAAGEPLRSA